MHGGFVEEVKRGKTRIGCIFIRMMQVGKISCVGVSEGRVKQLEGLRGIFWRGSEKETTRRPAPWLFKMTMQIKMISRTRGVRRAGGTSEEFKRWILKRK